jgi:predicted glutamine amidotransferase
MCRLFALTAAPHRADAAFWLLDAPDSLRDQSHRNPDGAGIGWFDAQGRPQRYRTPDPAFEDKGFADEAITESSTTFVAHVRHATAGGRSEANTHPFSFDGRLFAHNGVIEDLPALERELGPDLARVAGETDSERFFALVSREIAAQGDVREGIRAAAEWVAEHLPLHSLNFILTTPQDVWALRYPDSHELHLLVRPECSRAHEPVEHVSSLGLHVRVPGLCDRDTVVLASEQMDEDPGWRALESGELVRVGPGRAVTAEMLLPDAPRHLLTLSDLDAPSRAAQQPG